MNEVSCHWQVAEIDPLNKLSSLHPICWTTTFSFCIIIAHWGSMQSMTLNNSNHILCLTLTVQTKLSHYLSISQANGYFYCIVFFVCFFKNVKQGTLIKMIRLLTTHPRSIKGDHVAYNFFQDPPWGILFSLISKRTSTPWPNVWLRGAYLFSTS